ncbi:UbiH/UbiF/VisC/COQ6 family ubiquinone biosynthesis hydroxylase [Simiduia curdlanivorans]|uniref:UbiH/UbiF/VisC/COQ6 family ubiquinone biosynthesis hydroxylase n=1 Tax=Simiduia curdlanivorans TaxID=1492769 RepID=A0ABV8V5W2_9GAMM|nr:UbiH/UbiF/VisC/COQ6 family ubiquinone biosynthesis hydroxylase [Simiduia curdlanivorans]MDN3637433.1 UbiH/UbiF/VisC/COQ6 family ubiquinone biosynthesis hydroxylase [Simiduia curdlanivorans]
MTDKSNAFDIVVVGAGLVGALVALLITRQHPQLRIAVIEAADTLTVFDASVFDPRVVALTQTSVSALEGVGIWSKLQAQRVCAYREMDVWDAEGTGRIHFDAQASQQKQLGFIVENSLLVSHLQQAMSYAPNISLLLGEKVEQFTPPTMTGDETFAPTQLTLASGQMIQSLLVLAADGAHSQMRSLAQMATREWDYGHSAIVATITTEKPHGFVARQRFMMDGPLAFLPLQQAARAEQDEFHCSIVWSIETEKAQALMGLSDDAFCAQLTRRSEACLGQVLSIDKRFCIPLRQRHALDYVVPGLALLGDAAHTIHPLAGQGVNIGIKDALALVAELDRALQRGLPVAHMATLRRYQRARKAENLMMMLGMEGFKQLFASDSILLRWLRNEGVRQVDRQSLLKNALVNKVLGG